MPAPSRISPLPRVECPIPALDSEVTRTLLRLAQAGDRDALDTLFARSLPRLRRWARGRLPSAARRDTDTCDLVQEVALRALCRVPHLEATRAGGLDAYLRVGAMNAIRDHARRVARRPQFVEVADSLHAADPSPFDVYVGGQSQRRYRRALRELRPRDRRIAVAHIELGWNARRIARELDFPSVAAARMALRRAVDRLDAQMQAGHGSRRTPLKWN